MKAIEWDVCARNSSIWTHRVLHYFFAACVFVWVYSLRIGMRLYIIHITSYMAGDGC